MKTIRWCNRHLWFFPACRPASASGLWGIRGLRLRPAGKRSRRKPLKCSGLSEFIAAKGNQLAIRAEAETRLVVLLAG